MIVKLGDTVIDPLTGFTGLVTSRTEFLFGCVRLAVESKEMKDGKPVELYLDEQRVTVLPDSNEQAKQRAIWEGNRAQYLRKDPGGPGDVPPARRAPPSREISG
jgi:hypothetical protein